MVDAGRSVFAGGVAIGVVFGAVVGLGVVMRRFGLLSEVERPACVPPSPALGVEHEPVAGLRATRESSGKSTSGGPPERYGEAKSPTHKLLHATEFGSDDWSAMCRCGVIQHGCPSYAGCQAWIVVHASFAAKGLG